jgi:hypothetical protein
LIGIFVDNIDDVHNHIILNIIIHPFKVFGVGRCKIRGIINNVVITKLIIFKETEEGLENTQNGKTRSTPSSWKLSLFLMWS